MKKIEWKNFISGYGFEKTIKAVQQIKKELYHFLKHQGKSERWLINSIRLEHLQIKKHQKIALKYLQNLEDKVCEFEVKQQRRTDYKETYKIK